MRILDIDLDFFVRPIAHEREGSDRLPEAEVEEVASIDTISTFLETQCNLSRKRKTPGMLFEEHEEVFAAIRLMAEKQDIAGKLELDHVDAHSDTGSGWGISWRYVFTELLQQPPEGRLDPHRGPKALNSGNFIIFLAACRWLKCVNFYYPVGWKNEIQHVFMKDFSAYSPFIQLKRYNSEDIALAGVSAPLDKIPHELEPGIPFTCLPAKAMQPGAPYDWVFLTRSPAFTPKSADAAFDFISGYLELGK